MKRAFARRASTSVRAADSVCGPRTVCRTVLAFALACGLAGCSPVDDSAQDAIEEEAALPADGMDFSYSDRDLDASYDESSATAIALSDEGVSIAGSGASVQDGLTVIESAGTYVVSGSLSDGAIQVAAGEQDKVRLVFDGVDIHCEDGPAVSVLSADTCFITLADASSSSLSDGASYTLAEGEDEPNATLYSKADLTLNGTGSLAIAGSYRHAVCSKDDLVIAGGSYRLSSAEDALRGKDCVKIADGEFSIDAGGDAVVSTNDEDADRGFVSIDGGSFSLTAGDDGIQAARYVRLAGGTFDMQAADDAVHSDVDALVGGGTFSIAAGDDAFHAEESIAVQEATVDVSSCYEGIEGAQVYLQGGDVRIVADDDAVNAASPDASQDDVAEQEEAPGQEGAVPGREGAVPGQEGAVSGQDAAMPDQGEQAPPSAMPADGRNGEWSGPDGSGGQGAADAGAGDLSQGIADRPAQPNADASGAAPQADAAGGGAGMGDASCVIEITDGYYVLESGGDTLDSNGSIAFGGGVVLAQSAMGTSDFALDYDIEATVDGGVLIALGGTGMAQSLTSGSQAFAMANVEGSAGETISVVDANNEVLASFTAQRDFAAAVVSASGMVEGSTYRIVVGDAVSGANENGYASQGVLEAGGATEVTASCSAQSGFAGAAPNGQQAAERMPGDTSVG